MELRTIHLAALGLVLALVARHVVRRISLALFARRCGARPAPRMKPSAGFLGRKWMAGNAAAAKENRVLDLLSERYKSSGKTYSARIMGQNYYFTADPENIKYFFVCGFSGPSHSPAR
jgi:hypothetical protein